LIKSINHKGLRLLWEKGDSSKLPSTLVAKIEIVMDVIDSAKLMPQDLGAFKSWEVHKLSGDLQEFWSVKINKNYRIIFRFEGQDAYDLDYVDYH